MSTIKATEQSQETVQQQPKIVERIHVGGLDPSRLKGSEVAKRLGSIDGLLIESIDALNDTKPFFYVNASSDKEGFTALHLICKQYHNVRWKGCKIIVELAKPPFLDRLVSERTEKAQRDEERAERIAMYYNREQETETPKKIPRHMRIRQMYGTDAYHVDTKPCQVTEWTDFSKALLKMRSRRTKHSDEEQNMTKVFMNRAVHFRFPQEDEKTRKPLVHQWSDTEESSQSDMDGEMEQSAGKTPSYMWSDSEEEESSNPNSELQTVSRSSDIDTSAFALAMKENVPVYVPVLGTLAKDSTPKPQILKLESAIKERISDDSDGRDDDESPINDKDDSEEDEIKHDYSDNEASKQKKNEAKQSGIGFQWSSDEDDNGVVHEQPSSKQRTEENANDEFSAAVDFNIIRNDNDDSDGYDDEDEPYLVASTPMVDLNDDVKANLDILSTIFPEMETAPKKIFEPNGGVDAKAVNTFGSLGMQRYDPTKASSLVFEIKPNTQEEEVEGEGEEEEGGISEDNSEASDESENGRSDEEISPELAAPVPDADVYEEKKLEDIFRSARDVQDDGFLFGFGVTEGTNTSKKDDATGGSFSFGFDVVALNEQPKEEASSLLSLGVDSERTDGKLSAKSLLESMSEQPKKKRTRQRGFSFLQGTLTTYVNNYLDMNEGTYIAENPEAFRNDEEIKHSWKEERYALTLDWKRKKKYAQSQMQKRMKFR